MEKVLIGMSGGVDSAVAAALLKRSGYDVTGTTLLMYREDEQQQSRDVQDAKAVCERLGLSYMTADFRETFLQEVVSYFVKSYENGLTPNPCLICNRQVKFSALLQKATQDGIPYIATGHYSRIKKDGSGRTLLYRPSDRSKDQTYVLYRLPQEVLSRTLMPLADYTKEEVRQMATEWGLVNADRPDSQDICFIPDGDYAGFIRRLTGHEPQPGHYVDRQGHVLGRHKGLIHYTVGQRKGLGVSFGEPMFVCEKRAQTNEIVLCKEPDLYTKTVRINQLNFIPFERLDGSLRVTAKLRYRHTDQPATVTMVDENTAQLVFDEAQRAPTPGQAAVLYDGDLVIGGGTIL